MRPLCGSHSTEWQRLLVRSLRRSKSDQRLRAVGERLTIAVERWELHKLLHVSFDVCQTTYNGLTQQKLIRALRCDLSAARRARPVARPSRGHAAAAASGRVADADRRFL